MLARFVPIVRTFITVMAGVGRMAFRRFMTYSAIGGVLWATGVTLLGYWLGQVSFVRNNIEAMLLAIVLVSVVPIGVEFLPARAAAKVHDRKRSTQNAETSPARSRRDSARTTAACPCRRSEIPTSSASTGPSTGSGSDRRRRRPR